jgi:hypothetical protein
MSFVIKQIARGISLRARFYVRRNEVIRAEMPADADISAGRS